MLFSYFTSLSCSSFIKEKEVIIISLFGVELDDKMIDWFEYCQFCSCSCCILVLALFKNRALYCMLAPGQYTQEIFQLT